MDTLHTLLRRLASSLSSGDVEAAVALFSAEGRIVLHDGQHVTLTLSARAGLAAAVAAFSEIAYSSVLHLAGEGFSDDGVLSGIHRSTFLGCPPTGRRAFLNVHLGGQISEDGRLAELTVGSSVASLLHQLRGGGDTVAVADGLTAQVRHRMWSPHAESDDGAGVPGAGVRAAPADPAAVDVGLTGPPSRKGAGALAAAALLALLVGGLAVTLLPTIRGDHSEAAVAPVTSPSGTLSNGPTASSVGPSSVSAADSASSTASSETASGTPRIVVPTGPPQVQPGRQVVLPSDVLFGFDSAQLSPQTQATLTDLAHEILAAHVTGQIQVNGYTDNLGSAAHGLELSRQRALAVAQALQAALGDSPITLLPQGFGDADPIADNATEQGRTRNRRVTIVLPTTTP